jgi:hypothetical protein
VLGQEVERFVQQGSRSEGGGGAGIEAGHSFHTGQLYPVVLLLKLAATCNRMWEAA